MSGGRFNYQDMSLKNEIFGYTDRPNNVFEDREISALVWDVFDLIHAFDWYASGDTDIEDYKIEKQKFKDKWFRSREQIAKSTIDNAVEELRQELYDTCLPCE